MNDLSSSLTVNTKHLADDSNRNLTVIGTWWLVHYFLLYKTFKSGFGF